MENKIDVFKVTGYDNFKCTVDKCKFTCCEGWDISVDKNTFNKWNDKKYEFSYALNNIRVNENSDKEEYFIDKEIEDKCPMLDENGLCGIVKAHGEEYISLACQSFPRIKNDFDDRIEFSLSCSCPEVIEFISRYNDYIKIDTLSDNEDKSSLEFELRKTLINIIKGKDISLDYKLIIGFQMLLTILDNKNINEKELLNEVKRYKNKEYIKDILKIYKNVKLDRAESIEEINNLFIDIVENYRDVSGLQLVLERISSFSEEVEIEYLSDKWSFYKSEFEKYSKIFENCIISKILSNCINKDIEEVVVSFELIIVEFLLIRFSLFLRFCIDGKLNIEDIKDHIVVFSRIIENNSDAVREFLEEGFGSEILEEGYICFISLF